MRRGALCWVALLVTCTLLPGCLLNSVYRITSAPRAKPDSAHAIVVIGVQVAVAWPFTEFPLIFDEYSAEERRLTGTCFHYNRIEITRPSSPAEMMYFAYEVPANVYVFSGRNAGAALAPASMGHAFIAPPGATVYFGDYVFVGNGRVEFRRDIEAARAGLQSVLPRKASLDPAEETAVTNAPPLICTP